MATNRKAELASPATSDNTPDRMRWTQTLIPTLKEAPAEAETAYHEKMDDMSAAA